LRAQLRGALPPAPEAEVALSSGLLDEKEFVPRFRITFVPSIADSLTDLRTPVVVLGDSLSDVNACVDMRRARSRAPSPRRSGIGRRGSDKARFCVLLLVRPCSFLLSL
jgi:hypothetical protein